MRRVRHLFGLLSGPPTLLVAAAWTAGALAAQWGRIDARFDVLAEFAPVWLTGGAVAFGLALLFRGWTRVAIAATALVGLASAASLVAPEFLRDAGPRAGAQAADQLKLVQLNVWARNRDPAALLRWLDEERPDIVVVVENNDKFMAALRAHGGWRIACPGCEVMILSRRPALSTGLTPGLLGSEHVPPYTTATFLDRHGPFPVIGVHNAWPTEADQPLQEDRLQQAISQAKRDRLIVAGDFNSTPWSFSRRRRDRAYGVPRRDRGVATWPARSGGDPGYFGPPVLAIDHIYAGSAWATVSVRRGPRLSSDHYPVVAVLAPVAPR